MNKKEYDNEITMKELYAAYKIAAKIVSKYGNTYLPIFERLHSEIEKHEGQEKIKALAQKVAAEYKY